MLASLKLVVGLVVGVPAATVAATLASLLYCQIRNYLRYRSSGCTVPAAPERFLIGSFEPLEPHLMDKKLSEKMGSTFYWTLLSIPLISTSEIELAQLIFSKENFPKSIFYDSVASFTGENLLTLAHGKGGDWKGRRDLVNPAFKLANLKAMRPTFANHAIQFVSVLTQLPPGSSINFSQEIAKLTLDAISSAGFTHHLGAMETMGRENPVLDALQGVINNLSSPLMALPFGGSHIVPFLQRKNLAEINNLLYTVIDKRIKEQETGQKDPSRIPDLLDLMMVPGEDGRQLSREELRNELLIFYLAGYETTSTALSWAVYELARNPEVCQRLVDEVDSVMGPSAEVVCPSNEQMDEMTYMTMVLNETLRKYPPVIGNSRMIPETFEYNGWVFPKGITISVSILGIHRNEKYWPDPMKFDPERFTKENADGRSLYSFIPFSAGGRICVGKNFFYLEAKAILATMLRKIKFELDPTKESGREVSPSGLMRPNAVWIKLSNRADQ